MVKIARTSPATILITHTALTILTILTILKTLTTMCDKNCENCNNKEAEDPQKRKFLAWSVGAINLAVLVGIFAPLAGFIGSPLKKKEKGDWIDVMPEDELKAGEIKETRFKCRVEDGYQIVEREYVVFLKRYPDRIIAFDPACTHLGCRILYKGEQKKFLCPCHGGVFDEDGKVVSGPPPKPLETHGVKVENGRIYVDRRAGSAA